MGKNANNFSCLRFSDVDCVQHKSLSRTQLARLSRIIFYVRIRYFFSYRSPFYESIENDLLFARSNTWKVLILIKIFRSGRYSYCLSVCFIVCFKTLVIMYLSLFNTLLFLLRDHDYKIPPCVFVFLYPDGKHRDIKSHMHYTFSEFQYLIFPKFLKAPTRLTAAKPVETF